VIMWVTKLGSKIFLWMVANVATPQKWNQIVIVYMYLLGKFKKCNKRIGKRNLMMFHGLKINVCKTTWFLLFLYHWWTHGLFLDIIHELILLCDKACLYDEFGLWNKMFISYLFMKVQIFESWFSHNSNLHEKLLF
jgi:hypothetical protein